jgi:hypothetical protein
MSLSSLHAHPDTDPDKDWFADISAISHDAAVFLLKAAVEGGGVYSIECFRERYGDDPRSWIAVGQLMRAHYIREGMEKFHVTDRGRIGLEAFLHEHPEYSTMHAHAE